MSFIIIELHGGPAYAAIVTDEDGNKKVFDNLAEAEQEACDCQDGRIIEV